MTRSIKANKLAINGGTPYRTRLFTSWPFHNDEEVKAVADVAASGKWWRSAYSEAELQKPEPGSLEGAAASTLRRTVRESPPGEIRCRCDKRVSGTGNCRAGGRH